MLETYSISSKFSLSRFHVDSLNVKKTVVSRIIKCLLQLHSRFVFLKTGFSVHLLKNDKKILSAIFPVSDSWCVCVSPLSIFSNIKVCFPF